MVQQLKELDYPEGSILFDVRYSRSPETFEVIYWSPITQQLEVQYEQPIVDIWFLKEEYRTNKYQISQAEIDKCYPVYCNGIDRLRYILDIFRINGFVNNITLYIKE